MRTYKLDQTDEFADWIFGLKDRVARAKIFVRTGRLANGNMGDVKHFDGISELRIDHGPGYRVYFARSEHVVLLLLNGGDKSTQVKDIAKAKELLAASNALSRRVIDAQP